MKSQSAQSKKSKGRGGKRPGAGRKPKAKILTGSIERLNAAFEAAAPYVQDAMIDLVRGVYVEREIGKGIVRVYQQPPDRGMIIEVANRILGKSPEKHEHSGLIVSEVHVNDSGQPRKPDVE